MSPVLAEKYARLGLNEKISENCRIIVIKYFTATFILDANLNPEFAVPNSIYLFIYTKKKTKGFTGVAFII
jgi:hypothetical protein